MTKPTPKMLSFISDTEQEARIRKQCEAVQKRLEGEGIKTKYGLSQFVRAAIEEKLARDSKKKG